MNDESFYFVVLKNPGRFNHSSLADALASSISVLKVDAVMHLKNYWGLLHKTQEIDKAQELQEKLRQWGIQTFVISESEIKQLPAVKVLKQASLEEHGLVFEEEEQKKTLPWNSFVLVCAGQVIEIETVKKRTVGDGHYAKHLVTTGISFVSAVRISADRLKGKEVIEKNLGRVPKQMVVDGGFISRDNIIAMHDEKVDLIGPMPDDYARSAHQLSRCGIDPDFYPDKFSYNAKNDTYTCPAGKTLKYIWKVKNVG